MGSSTGPSVPQTRRRKHPLANQRLPCHFSEVNQRIVIDPAVCHGKPVLRGTRMPLALVMGSLAGGMSFEEVEAEYGLTRDDIRAAEVCR